MEETKSKIVFCTRCGTIVPNQANLYCTTCGKQLDKTSAEIFTFNNQENGKIESKKHSIPLFKIIGLIVAVTIGLTIGAISLSIGLDMYRRAFVQDLEEVDEDKDESEETESYSWEIDLSATGTYVVDGDTFDLSSKDRVRLADIDAPESGETGYQVAKNCLSSLVLNKQVYLDIDDKYQTDQYGRLVAVAFVRYNATHLVNVNKKMLTEGFAAVSDYDNQFNPSTWTLYVYHT